MASVNISDKWVSIVPFNVGLKMLKIVQPSLRPGYIMLQKCTVAYDIFIHLPILVFVPSIVQHLVGGGLFSHITNVSIVCE
jgi:hypothetical protein